MDIYISLSAKHKKGKNLAVLTRIESKQQVSGDEGCGFL